MTTRAEFEARLAGGGISKPPHGASEADLDAYIQRLEELLPRFETGALREECRKALARAKKSLWQKRWKSKSPRGHKVNPHLTDDETAVLDWIAREMFEAGDGKLVPSRSEAVRKLIRDFRKAKEDELKSEFTNELEALKMQSGQLADFWRKLTPNRRSQSHWVRTRAPRPPWRP